MPRHHKWNLYTDVSEANSPSVWSICRKTTPNTLLSIYHFRQPAQTAKARYQQPLCRSAALKEGSNNSKRPFDPRFAVPWGTTTSCRRPHDFTCLPTGYPESVGPSHAVHDSALQFCSLPMAKMWRRQLTVNSARARLRLLKFLRRFLFFTRAGVFLKKAKLLAQGVVIVASPWSENSWKCSLFSGAGQVGNRFRFGPTAFLGDFDSGSKTISLCNKKLN